MLVPANMTNFHQPLDLTVNGYVKKFMHGKFNAWCSLQSGNKIGCGKAVTRLWCSSSFIAFEALLGRMAGRMLQPHDNYSCVKCNLKWMEGRRNHGSSSGCSQRVSSVSRYWPINWVRRRWKQRNFQCYWGWHSSFKVKYYVDTQHDCDSGSNSEWENGDEIDFERNAFDPFDDETDL